MFRITEASRDQYSIKRRRKGLETLERVHTGQELPTKTERAVNFVRQIFPTIVHTIRDGNLAAHELKEYRKQASESISSGPALFDQDNP